MTPPQNSAAGQSGRIRTDGTLRVYEDPASLARAAAEEFFTRALENIRQGRVFRCALSGGSTPRLLHEKLADKTVLARLPPRFWESIHLFWGDERDVPPTHPDNNYAAVREALLDRIAFPEENVHRIKPESGGAAMAAAEYERELKALFGLAEGQLPRFDLIFLGMGEDGHVASLFPHSEALDEAVRMVAAPWIAKLGCFRITLTFPVINNAACVIFLVSGAGKAKLLRLVLSDAPISKQVPAQAVRPSRGDLLWLADRAALHVKGVEI